VTLYRYEHAPGPITISPLRERELRAHRGHDTNPIVLPKAHFAICQHVLAQPRRLRELRRDAHVELEWARRERHHFEGADVVDDEHATSIIGDGEVLAIPCLA
jgi:hypothetical protein